MQLAKEIGIRQSSAWFMLHRLREACGGPKLTKLRGIVELDECFIGGKERNKHASTRSFKAGHSGRFGDSLLCAGHRAARNRENCIYRISDRNQRRW